MLHNSNATIVYLYWYTIYLWSVFTHTYNVLSICYRLQSRKTEIIETIWKSTMTQLQFHYSTTFCLWCNPSSWQKYNWIICNWKRKNSLYLLILSLSYGLMDKYTKFVEMLRQKGEEGDAVFEKIVSDLSMWIRNNFNFSFILIQFFVQVFHEWMWLTHCFVLYCYQFHYMYCCMCRNQSKF